MNQNFKRSLCSHNIVFLFSQVVS